MGLSFLRKWERSERGQVAQYEIRCEAMAERVYGSLSARRMADVDVLVSPKRFAQAADILARNGFSPGSGFHWPRASMKSWAFVGTEDAQIDLHPRPLPAPPNEATESAMRVGSRRITISDRTFPTLSDSANLVVALVHGMQYDGRSSHQWILEEYLSEADELCQKYNIKTLYLSTESELEVQRAQKLRPQYRILSLPHDRNIFPQIADSNEFIERRSLRDPSCIEALVTSALADLHFLARCSGFIGTFNSEFSVLAWLLCFAENKHLVPYINMTPRNALAYNQSNLEFWPS
jgi:hypothetical protein